MEDLEQIRKQIDVIDEQIVKLIAERRSYMPAVAAYKKKNNLPLFQPERENELLASKKELAGRLNVDSVLINKIYTLILEDSKKLQKEAK